MPFMNPDDKVPYVYVNPDDPLGEHPEKFQPVSWNLEPDPERPGKNRQMRRDNPLFSVWWFKAWQSDEDDMLITQKVSRTQIKYNSRKAKRMGSRYTPEFDQIQKMGAAMALITTMSRGWEGPEFSVPDFVKSQNGKPHPLIGQQAPCSPEFMRLRDKRELHAVEVFLDQLYEPEPDDEDDVNEFQEGDSSLDRPEGEADGGDAGGPRGDALAMRQGVRLGVRADRKVSKELAQEAGPN